MKRIAGMILVVAMVASLGIVSVFAADTREDEMPATCIAEITESGEVIYYVEDEPKENDEARKSRHRIFPAWPDGFGSDTGTSSPDREKCSWWF